MALSSVPRKGRSTSESLATVSQSSVCLNRLRSAESRLILAAIPIELSNMQQKSQDAVVSAFGGGVMSGGLKRRSQERLQKR